MGDGLCEMGDGLCVQPSSLVSWAIKSAHSSCDLGHLFVWTSKIVRVLIDEDKRTRQSKHCFT